MRPVKTYLDYPPIWTLGFMIVTYGARRLGLGFSMPPLGQWLGGALIAIGIFLMFAAVFAMWRHRTTVIPHRVPSAIVTTGIYSFTRNPIYLGDVFTLVGFAILCGSPLGVLLVPIFMIVIERRFIREEETWLRTKFGLEFATWAKATGRWL